jgi:uncharacterized OsmC-like protein
VSDELEPIRAALAAASSYLSEHPDEAHYTDSAATATVDGGLRISVTGPDGATLVTDMPHSVGGGGSAPSPGWFLRAAEASCVATLMTMRAASLGHPITGLSVTVDSESDDRGILGLDDSVPAGPLSTLIVVQASGISEPTLRELAEWAVAHCPVTDAVRRAVPIELALDSTT